MPGSTPVRGIPYPSPTDPINAYPALAQSAAQNLDTHTHDKTTVGSAVNADYATNAGNANTLDGLDSTAFAPASHAVHPQGGTTIITTDGNGEFVLGANFPICQNGDYVASGDLMVFQSYSNGRTRARLLWGNADGGLVIIGSGQPAAGITLRINWVGW